MKKFYCEKLMFVVNSYTAGVFNKHCLLTLFFHSYCFVLVLKHFVLFAPYVCFHILVKFR